MESGPVISRTVTSEQLAELGEYNACDISDALLALDKAFSPNRRKHGGFLHDLMLRNSTSASRNSAATGMKVYHAFTVQFQPLSGSLVSADALPKAAANIPSGAQWSDLAEPGTIVVVQQPPSQRNACVGGIHMMRLFRLGVKGLVVDGRIRDLGQCREIDMPIWSMSTSTVGAGAECKAHAVNVPITFCGIEIMPRDVICMDEAESGVVHIPAGFVSDILEFLRRRGDNEDKIMGFVRSGGTVAEAFKKFRK